MYSRFSHGSWSLLSHRSPGHSFSHMNTSPQQPLAPASVFRLSFRILFPIGDPVAAHTSSVNTCTGRRGRGERPRHSPPDRCALSPAPRSQQPVRTHFLLPASHSSPSASRTGVGKSGPEASAEAAGGQRSLWGSGGDHRIIPHHPPREWRPGQDCSKGATLEVSASELNLGLLAAEGGAQLSGSPSIVRAHEIH